MVYDKKQYQKIRLTKPWLKPEVKKKTAINYQNFKKKNLKKVLLGHKSYYEKNSEKMKIQTAKKTRERSDKLKTIIIEHYTDGTCECACCGQKISNLLFGTVDHINNDDGKEFRKKQKKAKKYAGITFYKWIINSNFPKDLQILCWNCNRGKARNGGICPHTQSDP